jgi:hypothetical protein
MEFTVIRRTIEADARVQSSYDIPGFDGVIRWTVQDEYGLVVDHFGSEKEAIEAVESGKLDSMLFDLE